MVAEESGVAAGTTILAALGLLMLQTPDEAERDALRMRVESSPREVAAFIERRAGCNHFQGEEPYDRQRAEEIGRALRELRCASIDADEQALRRTYRDQPAVLQLLHDTQDLLGW